MNSKQICGCLIISIILMCAVAPQSTSAKRVIFYRKDGTVLHSQLLAMQARKAPCPKGQLRDHRNRCRRAVVFGRFTRD
uniref:Secreted protein n=1 Tax=Musca domestica TaxID=7370 RepID=A0A1I8MUL2_MUSDO